MQKKKNMITEIKNLIQHKYDYDEISSRISPNCMKDIDMEWNKEENIIHPFAADILNNDLVLTIEDISKHEEVYAYFFFKVQLLKLGIKAYKLEKIILDSGMSDNFIIHCISSILINLLNGDDTIKDRVIVKDNYPLVSYHFEETKEKVIKDILAEFHLIKEGMIPNELMEDFLIRICRKNK